MASFMKISLYGAIFSSIYNTHDNANIVCTSHWPISVCNCHCMNECLLMVFTLKASLQTQASQCSYPAPECVLNGGKSESLLGLGLG